MRKRQSADEITKRSDYETRLSLRHLADASVLRNTPQLTEILGTSERIVFDPSTC